MKVFTCNWDGEGPTWEMVAIDFKNKKDGGTISDDADPIMCMDDMHKAYMALSIIVIIYNYF